MLKFWSTDDGKLFDKAFGPGLRSFRPKVPPYACLAFKEGQPPPEPEPGDVILACGNKPLEALRAAGIAPKNRTLNGLRETPFKRNGGFFLLTFDPYVTTTEDKTKEIVSWDVRLAHRLLTMGNLEPQVGDYVWVSSYTKMIAEFEKTGKFQKTIRGECRAGLGVQLVAHVGDSSMARPRVLCRSRTWASVKRAS